MRALLAAPLVAAIACPAAAQNYGMIYGVTPITCGIYISSYGPGTSNRVGLTSWLAGFVSAYNSYSTNNNLLAGSDIESAMLWIENYCRQNPLSNFLEGTFALVDLLDGR